MRVLVDTQVFLWLHSEPERLGANLAALEDPATVRLVSAVVGWEIAIKHGLGRLTLPAPPAQWVPEKVDAGAMTPVAVELSHALAVASLPMHHRDPFDRLLIVQAQLLGVPILTADETFARYEVDLVRVSV